MGGVSIFCGLIWDLSFSGWLDSSDLKISNNFLEEDDLGFDPFHETQKALAEMLESESKAAETVVPNKVKDFF